MKLRNKNLLIGGIIALTSATISSIATYFIHTEWCYKTIYEYAATLYNEGAYEEAILKFQEIEGYKNADDYILLCKEILTREKIEKLIDVKDYESARELFDNAVESGCIFSNRTKDIIRTELHILHDSLHNEDM